jgi:hypothetical protein
MIRLPAVLLAVAVLGAEVLVAGCDSRPPQVPRTAAPPVALGDPREEAARLAARGDFAAAERRYRQALTSEPDDVELHFGLGSVLSQLDRREAAAEEFRWVVAHGRPGRPEVDSARRWLAEAGDPAARATVSAAVAPEPTSLGGVSGKLTWPNLPTNKEFGIRVVVERDGEGAFHKSAKTKLNGTFSILGLPEGSYKLTGLAGPVRVWSDLPVTVTPGRETTVDLSPSNAILSATEFPARAR